MSAAEKEDQDLTDYLLSCLLSISKYYGRTISPQALRANLPLADHKLTPSLFVKAAERIQLSAYLAERKLSDISEQALPAVLLLKENKACVLMHVYDDGSAEFIFPKKNEDSVVLRLPLKDIEENYLGQAFYLKPTYHFEERAEAYQVDTPKSWFWHTIWQYRHLYYHVAFASLLINCFIMTTPIFVMNVYDRVVPNQTMLTLWVLTFAIVVIYIFDFIIKIIRGYLIDISGKKADVILSSVLFDHLLSLEFSAKPTSAGAFANNIHGFEAVRDFFTSATLASFIDLPFIFLFILVIAYIGGWLAIIPLLAIPMVVIASLIFEIPIRKSVEMGFIGAAQKQAILVEAIDRLETIKTSQAEGEYLRKWDYFTALVAKWGMKSRFYSALAINFASYILQMVYVIVIVAGIYQINAGLLTLGGLIACSILASRTLAPLTQIASLITRYHQAKIGLHTLDQVMALPIERPNKQKYIYRPTLQGNIQFDNVSFTYPKQLTQALRQISFKVNAKEKIAILGRVGSGKSTLLKLLIGLYKPSSGNLLIDDINIDQIDPADIRSNMGYVPQDTGLFYGTLRDNMRKSAPWATPGDLLRIAEITGISHYTKAHPTGFDLMIGENGAGLSGGQQQSVAIARALLANPSILLLDDCTSEMDDNSEQELRDQLKNYVADKTLILVTHKASMLDLVDRILILDHGLLVRDGTKEEILKLLGK